MREKFLNEIVPGEYASVKNIDAPFETKRRLLDMGLISGTKIKCLNISPFGDPTAYLIRGTVIALRSEDSKKISVSKSEADI